MTARRGYSARHRIDAISRSTGRRTAVALAGVAAAAGTMMVLSANSAGASPAGADKPAAKYYVCKYVGKPGVDEVLKGGKNPIVVSGNAIIENPVVVGSYFVDAQGRSLVLAEYPQNPAPGRSACPLGGSSSSVPPSSEPPSSQPPSSQPPSSQPPSSEPPSSEPPSSEPPSSEPPSNPATSSGPPSSQPPSTPTSSEPAPATSSQPTKASSSSSSASIEGQQTSHAAESSDPPIPAGVSAGLHTPVRDSGLKAWGVVLMLLGAAAGLGAVAWPMRRRVG